MTKEEFLERTPGTEKPTQEQWDIIETVYNYHPSISETNGKSQIAYLYKVLKGIPDFFES